MEELRRRELKARHPERVDSPEILPCDGLTADERQRPQLTSLAEEMVIHWARELRQQRDEAIEMATLEPWQRWRAEKMVEYNGDPARYHDWEALVDWILMQAERSMIGVEVGRAEDIMCECLDQVTETLGLDYRRKIIRKMSDERKGEYFDLKVSAEQKVRYIKAVVHMDVFDVNDISLVEAERDVIVNRAIASLSLIHI